MLIYPSSNNEHNHTQPHLHNQEFFRYLATSEGIVAGVVTPTAYEVLEFHFSVGGSYTMLKKECAAITKLLKQNDVNYKGPSQQDIRKLRYVR